MKRFSFLFAVVAISGLLFTTSCSEDECTPPALAENIVGTWTLTGSTVEFQADGTIIDPDDAVIGGEINGTVLDQKSYTIIDDMTISVRAESGSLFVESEFDITDSQCDAITLSVFGFDVTMNRQ
jgi:hypothetical protein